MAWLSPRGSRTVSLFVLLLLGAGVLASNTAIAQRLGQKDELNLQSSGPARVLPAHIFGANVESAYFEHLDGDQGKLQCARDMNFALIRFPGGSLSNYYHWQDGHISVPAYSNSSKYTKYWVQLSQKLNARNPQGSKIENYCKSAGLLGAKLVLVPNLETATVADQLAWFKEMKQHGTLPERIEMGNEFYLFMGNDPNVLKKWPDAVTSMNVMKQYADAFRTVLSPMAKIAVQAAGAAYQTPPDSRDRYHRQFVRWDEDLKPSPWFDAVTVHLYPRLEEQLQSPENPKGIELYHVLMAHCNQGVDRVLADISKRLPGKEIWVTEYNAHGEQMREGPSPVTPAMEMQANTRMALAFLRNANLGAALYFSLDYQGRLFNKAGRTGSYVPNPTAVALAWLDDAANGGATYQRVVDAGEPLIEGGAWGYGRESYRGVDAAIFKHADRTVLIVQNSTRQPHSFETKQLVPGKAPRLIESVSAPRILAQDDSPPQVERQKPGNNQIELMPYSICRVVW